ncbi:hypothetical protein RFI_08671 [Reticulomyxa filosa]|uniref:Uncharacterized protein n=1 Tax=Reticulomyxa filosa TaxID=46433 RepID=X6NR38_RETFI|nr:hypothetical protein RFI_08671 [Reticulomyxa filosa]|eukprot:ETO28461.1 hypothetical protein RFI_08671 [Reticulomyxa filosa]
MDCATAAATATATATAAAGKEKVDIARMDTKELWTIFQEILHTIDRVRGMTGIGVSSYPRLLTTLRRAQLPCAFYQPKWYYAQFFQSRLRYFLEASTVRTYIHSSLSAHQFTSQKPNGPDFKKARKKKKKKRREREEGKRYTLAKEEKKRGTKKKKKDKTTQYKKRLKLKRKHVHNKITTRACHK